jgi:mono/diheme cytochrome c family protein
LITLVLNGLEGSITVNGENFINAMPQHSFLSDEEAANVLSYIRQNFGNKASAIKPEEVKAIRSSLPPRKRS